MPTVYHPAPIRVARLIAPLLLLAATRAALGADPPRWGPHAGLAALLGSPPQPMPPEGDWASVAAQCFDRPDAARIVADVTARHPDREHPRILATAADFAALRRRLTQDPRSAACFGRVRSTAERILTEAPASGPSRHLLLNRLLPLGLVYRVTGETRYATRAWAELEAYMGFADWHATTQFLDIAYIAKGFAVGFDWFYQAWSPAQRQRLADTVTARVLRPVLVAYAHPQDYAPYQNRKITGWDNWNASINAGALLLALALCDEPNQADLAGRVAAGALHHWENYLKEFAPDGACREGLSYWYWGVQSLVEGQASLWAAAGTDYGSGRAPGLATTAYFPVFLSGPAGAFNFGNAQARPGSYAEFYWFARRYRDPKLARLRTTYLDRHPEDAGVYDCLWGDPALMGGPVAETGWPLDMWFRNTETAALRSAWDDHALFAAIKGGDNLATHGHLNTGSFVLDALGRRWAVQLGGDSYHNPGYFSKGRRDSQGYTYYRVRAEGQNTLVIDPNRLADQVPTAVSRIVHVASSAARGLVVIDMTPAYAHQARRVGRGLRLERHTERVLLRDEIRNRAPAPVWWFMHTRAAIELSADGRGATLTLGDDHLDVRLLSSAPAARFTVREAVPLPSSPQSPLNAPNPGIRKLTVHLEAVRDLDLTVVFTPRTGHAPPAALPAIVPLADW